MATCLSGEGFWGRSVVNAWSNCAAFLKTRPQLQSKGSGPVKWLTFGNWVRGNDAQLWQPKSMFLPPGLVFSGIYTKWYCGTAHLFHSFHLQNNAFWLHLCPRFPLLHISLLCLWWLNATTCLLLLWDPIISTETREPILIAYKGEQPQIFFPH